MQLMKASSCALLVFQKRCTLLAVIAKNQTRYAILSHHRNIPCCFHLAIRKICSATLLDNVNAKARERADQSQCDFEEPDL
jgi:hypothetical protein